METTFYKAVIVLSVLATLTISILILVKVDKQASRQGYLKPKPSKKLKVKDYPIAICEGVPQVTPQDCAKWATQGPSDLCTDSGGNSTDCASAMQCCKAVCCNGNCDASQVCNSS